MNNISLTEKFCLSILKLDIKYAKPLANLLVALASEQEAERVVQLSLSPFYQYHDSMLGKTLTHLGHQLEENLKSSLRKLFFTYFEQDIKNSEAAVLKTSTDFTTLCKPESPTLKDRGFVHIPNVRIKGNKPINIGYYLSCLNLHVYDENEQSSAPTWSIPLDTQRVDVDADKIALVVEQMKQLYQDPALPFTQSKQIINTADSGYTVPEFIAPLIEKFDNLLLVNRLRYGVKVYQRYQGEACSWGRPQVYGSTPYYLQLENTHEFTHPKTKKRFIKYQDSIFDLPPSEQVSYSTRLGNGRQVAVYLTRWYDLLLRGKQGHKMSDKPFDLVGVDVVDKHTGKALFLRPMFIGVWGKSRRTRSTKAIQWDYKNRYAIESHNRFSKQQLLLDKYQTSGVKSLDAWLLVVQLTYQLLYLASEEVDLVVNPWEKYLPTVKKAKESGGRKSVALTRKGTKRLFSTFDLTPFTPRKSNKGKGRKKGTVLPKKKRYPPRRKQKNEQNKKQKVEKLE